ncbi:hypothetical protein PoB_004684600 [Plakobranchus ocellatus]|uniref:Uncharacterized protein n=1 Tax=Plakobranchus ocellatus TaxID=259542 RepID=A0AAV4BMU8_9GAST|nr:hypothetical protein PoB_004684600 [Plakobranchus ocellatus]
MYLLQHFSRLHKKKRCFRFISKGCGMRRGKEVRSARRRAVGETRWTSGMMRGGETRGGEGRERERWRKRNNNAGGDTKGRTRKSGREKSREGEEELKRKE